MLGRKIVVFSVIGATAALFAGAGLAMAQTTPTVAPDTATTAPGVPVVINVLANDTDTLGNFVPGTIAVASPPASGAAISNGDGTITYSPAAAFTGVDQFSYTVCDDEAVAFCGSATVTVNVTTEAPTATPTDTTTPVPTLETWPIANADSAGTDQGKPVSINILANDSDSAAAIDLTSLKIVTQPTGGSASIDTSSGVATYSPNGTFTGSDTFVYQECDLQADPHCSQATVTVTVSPLATATPTTPVATPMATDTPTATATAPVEVATPKPPSTGSGEAAQSPNATTLLLLAAIGVAAMGAAGAVAGYTLTNRGR